MLRNDLLNGNEKVLQHYTAKLSSHWYSILVVETTPTRGWII